MNGDGEGTPYAMRTWGAIFVEVGVDPDFGCCGCGARSASTPPGASSTR